MAFLPSVYSGACDCYGDAHDPGCDYGSASVSAASPEQLAFVAKVKSKLSFSPTVSSYGRTPYEQGAAMLAKHASAGGGSKGDAELYNTYAADSSVKTLLSLSPRNADTWGAWIAKYGLNLSRHLRGAAVDYSVRGLSRSQIDALKSAIDAVGGRALEEFAPPHVHADISKTGAVASDVAVVAQEQAKRPWMWMILAGIGGFFGYRELKKRGMIR